MNRELKKQKLAAILLALALPVCASARVEGKKKKNRAVTPIVFAETPPPTQPVAGRPPAAPLRENGSLFTADAPGTNLLSDFKPRGLGDLVFVDVVESSEANVQSNANRNRNSGTLGGLVGAAGALPVPGAAVVGGVIGGLGTRKYEGKGSTGRKTDARARIVARVVEVLPNGDFRIQAEKFVRINKEDERLLLSGIVRQRDVTSENTVATTMVGDLRVELNGKGVASADNAPGWLYRLFEKIAPF
jgi:flagellar L-ring protein precursor FlgH